MPLPIVSQRAPVDAPFARAVEDRFVAQLQGKTLVEGLALYHRMTGDLLSGALGDQRVACASGCSTCCHQPLYVSFVELAGLVLSDEGRFFGAPFGPALKASTDRIASWRKAGADSPKALAHAQFAARSPCVLLGPDGACTSYEARPFLCRNAWSDTTCTFDVFTPGGFGDLASVARLLRSALHREYRLDRFDDARIKTATAHFLLPEGLAWIRKDVKRPLLFRVFREERAGSIGRAGP